MARSSRAIGRFYEDKVCDYYNILGFFAWAVPTSRWGKHKYRTTDIFNVFDVVATSKDRFVMIQVKKDRSLVLRKKVIEEIMAIDVPNGIDKEYWVFDDKGEALVLCISDNKISKRKMKI